MSDSKIKMKNKLNRMSCERVNIHFYDIFDGWVDVKTNLSKEEAYKIWLKATYDGTKNISSDDGDYYDIFPTITRISYVTSFKGS